MILIVTVTVTMAVTVNMTRPILRLWSPPSGSDDDNVVTAGQTGSHQKVYVTQCVQKSASLSLSLSQRLSQS